QTGSQANGQVSASTPADPLTNSTELKPQDRVFGVLASGMMDISAGSMRETGRSLDVGLDGQGFLAVRTPRGEGYTRAGALTGDSQSRWLNLALRKKHSRVSSARTLGQSDDARAQEGG